MLWSGLDLSLTAARQRSCRISQQGPIGGGGVAAAAPTAAASSSHVDIGDVRRHLPLKPRHKAGAPLMAALTAMTARGGCHLCRCLHDPLSCGGGLARRPPTSMPRRRRQCWAPPPLVLTAVGRGHSPLAAWTNLLLHRSCNDLTLSRDLCVV